MCGLGHKSLYITRSVLAGGRRAVVVAQHADGDLVSACTEAGARVVSGDARDPDVLAAAAVGRADTLIVVAGAESVNAEIIARAGDLAAEVSRDSDLLCIAHITSPELCSALRADEILKGAERNARLDFFNIFERGARELLAIAPVRTGRSIVILGLTDFGRAVVVEVARTRDATPSPSRR